MLVELVRTVAGILPGAAPAPEPQCAGHHWHMSVRGWVCCWCPTRIRSRADAPDSVSVCVQDDPPVDELQTWLWDLVEPAQRPVLGLRRRLGGDGPA